MSAQCLYGVHKNWITGQTATWAAANNISFSELLIKFWQLTPRELQVIDYKENTAKNVLVKPHTLIHPSLGFLEPSAPEVCPSDHGQKFFCVLELSFHPERAENSTNTATCDAMQSCKHPSL